MRRGLLLFVVGSAACRTATRDSSDSTAGTIDVRSASGASHGTLVLESRREGIRVRGTLAGLPAGAHGIHFHQIARCDPPDFTTAGPHFNPTGSLHGLQNPLGPHAGDLPNVTVGSTGRADVDLVSTRVSADAQPGGLFDADGTALVIHAAADDQRTDPAGNSGARIACGVVARRR